jgi:hypothetical protein
MLPLLTFLKKFKIISGNNGVAANVMSLAATSKKNNIVAATKVAANECLLATTRSRR